eukprot:5027531-Pyramimonas_sp.AAC.1
MCHTCRPRPLRTPPGRTPARARLFAEPAPAVYSHDGPIRRRKSVGIFSRWANQTKEAWVYSHDGPIRRRKNVGIFSRWTNQPQEKRGYILTMDQSDAGKTWVYSYDGRVSGVLSASLPEWHRRTHQSSQHVYRVVFEMWRARSPQARLRRGSTGGPKGVHRGSGGGPKGA